MSEADSEITRRKSRAAAGQTDRARWEDAASYEPFWSDRSVAAAALCRPGEWVCDIGCGMQGLGKLLPPGCVYLPADLRRWTPAVAECDLNAGRLPDRHLARCDVVALLGVVEYVNDLPGVLAQLAGRVEALVISYNCAELAEVDRAGFGWVNALTGEAFLALLRAAGFRPDHAARFGAMELLVRASNPGFGARRRLGRSVARVRHGRY